MMNVNEFHGHKHYITIDKNNRVIAGWSDGIFPEKDTSNAICINEHGDYQFRLLEDEEYNPMLVDMDDIPLYKWDGNQVLHRTSEEIESDRLNVIENQVTPVSEQDKLRADLDYVMLMMGMDVDPN